MTLLNLPSSSFLTDKPPGLSVIKKKSSVFLVVMNFTEEISQKRAFLGSVWQVTLLFFFFFFLAVFIKPKLKGWGSSLP